MRARARVIVLSLVALALAACAEPTPQERHERADALALVFARWVFGRYAARVAAERGDPAPQAEARARAREDLARALEKAGGELPEGEDLHATVLAVKEALASGDYVFLPLSERGEIDDDERGVWLAKVRSRDAARAQEIWGRRIEYKRIVYDTYLEEYPSWRASQLRVEPPVYFPGRFAGATVYIDHQAVGAVARARLADERGPKRAAHRELRTEEAVREVELRQAAYMLFSKEAERAGGLGTAEDRTRLHERVLWTALRYGEPEVAVAGVVALVENESFPDLREAAIRVRARLPRLELLASPAERAAAVKKCAEESFPLVGG